MERLHAQTGQPTSDSLQRALKAREAFIEGTTLQLQGNRHAEAILEFQESLLYDSSAVTLTAMARSYLELQKLDRAEVHVRHALQLDERSRDAWELLAEILIASGRYDEGVQAYEHILGLEPTRRQLYTLGRLHEPRNAKRAAEMYERYVALDPDPDVYLRLADLYERLADKPRRISALERARDLRPSDERLRGELINAYLEAGRIADAAAVARTQTSGADVLWSTLLRGIAADSLLMAMYRDDVETVLDETLSTYHESFYLLLSAGAVALSIKDLDRATRMLDLAPLQLSSYHRNGGLVQICALYLHHGYPAQALAFAMEHQPHYPEDPRFLLVMADANAALDNPDAAIDLYRAALDLDSTIIDALLQLGILLDNAGRYKESDAAYQRALTLDRNNATAANNYAYSLVLHGGNLDSAQALAWNAVQQYPHNPAYLDTYAWVLFKNGDPERALKYIEQAIRYGGNATHYEHLGDILESLGNVQSAIEAWERAMTKDPDRTYLRSRIDRYR